MATLSRVLSKTLIDLVTLHLLETKVEGQSVWLGGIRTGTRAINTAVYWSYHCTKQVDRTSYFKARSLYITVCIRIESWTEFQVLYPGFCILWKDYKEWPENVGKIGCWFNILWVLSIENLCCMKFNLTYIFMRKLVKIDNSFTRKLLNGLDEIWLTETGL